MLRTYLDESEALRHRLLAVADADMAAYGAVVKTFAMPKTTPAAQTARTLAMQQALEVATETPYEIVAHSISVMQLIEPTATTASRPVASDATTASFSGQWRCAERTSQRTRATWVPSVTRPSSLPGPPKPIG